MDGNPAEVEAALLRYAHVARDRGLDIISDGLCPPCRRGPVVGGRSAPSCRAQPTEGEGLTMRSVVEAAEGMVAVRDGSNAAFKHALDVLTARVEAYRDQEAALRAVGRTDCDADWLPDDVQFAVDARADMLALAAAVRRLRAEVERMRPVVAAAQAWEDADDFSWEAEVGALSESVKVYRAREVEPCPS